MFKGSIVALITPFTSEGALDLSTLRELIEWHCEKGGDGMVLCGSTGEAPTVREEERAQIIRSAVEIAKGRMPIIIGTGTYDTYKSICWTKQAKELGADGCLVVVPYYNRPTPEGCYRHFQAISEVGFPMIPYHHPGRTGIRLPIQTVARIAALPHVVAIKEATGDVGYAIELMRQIDIPLLSGDDILALALIAQGAKGVFSVVANLIPQEWKEMCSYLLQGDFEKGKALFLRYQPLIESMALETNPQCIKYAVSRLLKCSPHLRLPLIEPQEETKKKIDLLLHALCFDITPTKRIENSAQKNPKIDRSLVTKEVY